MRYEILGETLPVVICYLESGEKMVTEGGGMSWMSPNMKMETTSNGGIGKRSAVRRKERRLLKEKKVGRRRKRRTAVGRKSACAEPGEKLSINDISN